MAGMLAQGSGQIDAGLDALNNGWVKRFVPVLNTMIFTIFVPGIVAGYVPWTLRRPQAVAAHGIEEAAAIALLLAGVLIYLHTAFYGFAWTGGGTPAPIAPTKRLVVVGLHRYVRNPMYLGVLTVIGGQAWLFHSRATVFYFVFFWLAANLFVLLYEEPTLKQQFGEDYEAYRARVPRWVPRVRL